MRPVLLSTSDRFNIHAILHFAITEILSASSFSVCRASDISVHAELSQTSTLPVPGCCNWMPDKAIRGAANRMATPAAAAFTICP